MRTWMVVFGVLVSVLSRVDAQTPPATPTQIVIGRDPREMREVVGKNFLLRVWLSDVGGAGVQQIRAVRVDPDGNIVMKGLAATKAEGVTVAALEQQVTSVYKASAPTALARINVIDRTPPAPPAPPPPPPPPSTSPAIAPPPTVTPSTVAPVAAALVPRTEPSAKPQAASQPVTPVSTTAPVAATAPATQPAS